jgi:DNA-binding NtrC family response regulator
MKTVLVIDDEEKATWAFEQFLEGQGYRPLVAHTAEDGLDKVRDELPDIVICDIRLPGLSGLDAVPRIREIHPDAYVIVMTAYGTAQTAIEAIQRGAYDYLTKPLDLLERIERAHSLRGKLTHSVSDEPALDPDAAPVRLVGESPAMQEIYKLIGMLTMNRVTVLIEGESGTGKEGVARMIHHNSPERDRPFIAVNCGALAESLLESGGVDAGSAVAGAPRGHTHAHRALLGTRVQGTRAPASGSRSQGDGSACKLPVVRQRPGVGERHPARGGVRARRRHPC